MSAFRQAISEGDGISLIPLLEGEPGALRAEGGLVAEAVAVSRPELARRANEATELPVLLRRPLSTSADLDTLDPQLRSVACALLSAASDQLEQLYDLAIASGYDCAVEIRDERELESALERLDPDILLLSVEGGEGIEDTVDLLASIPAGKLVIAAVSRLDREELAGLERAGVDAVLVIESALSGL